MKKFFTLRTKLFMAFFALTAIITIAISYKLYVHMKTDHLGTLKRDLSIITSLALTQEEGRILQKVAVKGDKAEISSAAKELRRILTSEGLEIDKVAVWQVLNSKDYIYLTEDTMPRYDFNPEIPPPNLQISDIDHVIVMSDNLDFGIMVYAPLKDVSNRTVAIVGIKVNSALITEDIRHFSLQVASVAIMAIMIVSVISFWLSRGFCRRLTRLNDAIDEIAAGNMNIVVPESGQDEVTVLAQRINKLAVTLSNEREEMLLSAIESLVAALEAKDSYTYGHSSQVSTIANAIASKIGLSEHERFFVRIAALLHDIGKIGIPEQILNKPGQLDREERRVIEQHPEIGAKILKGIPALVRVTEIVKHHHARWDGKGYPEALAGEEIPLGARIIAIADTYQAMTSDRPYRNGLLGNIAMDELCRCAGSQFDPSLVGVFAEVWPEFSGRNYAE